MIQKQSSQEVTLSGFDLETVAPKHVFLTARLRRHRTGIFELYWYFVAVTYWLLSSANEPISRTRGGNGPNSTLRA